MKIVEFVDELKGDGTVSLYKNEEGTLVVRKCYDEEEDAGYAMFINEYDFLLQLQDFDFIPKVISYTEKDGISELIEEYIDGLTIDDWIRKNKPSKEERAKIFLQILKEIQKIHDRHIVHKDIKPNNFIIKNGKVYVIDFGISSYDGEEAPYIAGNSFSCYQQKDYYNTHPADYSWDTFALGGLYRYIMDTAANEVIAQEFASQSTYMTTELRMDLEDMINTIENFYKI